MKNIPNFIIHSIDKKSNSIFAYTSYDLKEEQQWRWFAINIAVAYEVYFENFKIYLFTSKKQTDKFINNIESKKEHGGDTKKAFKLFFESSMDKITVISNPLMDDNIEIIFSKDLNDYSDIYDIDMKNSSRYKNFEDFEVFPNLSFYIEDFHIEMSEENIKTNVFSNMLVSAEKNLQEEDIFILTRLLSNLFSQYQIMKEISFETNIENIEERITIINKDKSELFKQKTKNIKRGSPQEAEIKKDLNKNKDIIYSEFLFTSFFTDEDIENYSFNNSKTKKEALAAIFMYPFSNTEEAIKYIPQMYYLPCDKEYFELKGYKADKRGN